MQEDGQRPDEELWAQARHLYHTLTLIRQKIVTRCVGDEAPELTVGQMTAMWTISERGRVRVKELAEALGVSAPSASAMVERLVECGAVTREQSPADRREVVIQVSPEGAARLQRMEEHVMQSLVDLLRRVGPEYAEMWRQTYDRIRDVLDDENAGAAPGDQTPEASSRR